MEDVLDLASLSILASDTTIDFGGRYMGVARVDLGSLEGHSSLTLRNIHMDVTGRITIGEFGTARFAINQNAQLTADEFRIFQRGMVHLNGGSLFLRVGRVPGVIDTGGSFSISNSGLLSISSGDHLLNHGVFSGNGTVLGDILNTVEGRISVNSGDYLRMSGFLGGTNLGTIDVISGQFEVSSGVVNEQNARITARNGIMRFEQGLTNNGGIGFSFGTMDVFGDVTNNNQGSIVVTGNSNATLYDDITNNGEFRVSRGSTLVVFGDFSGANGITGGGDVFLEGDLRPGNSPALVRFESDVYLSNDTILNIEMGGLTIGDEYDSLFIDGLLDLDGFLEVVLRDGFTPQFGDAFTLIEADAITGDFDELDLPNLGSSLQWQIHRDGQTFALTVVPEPGLGGILVLSIFAAGFPRMRGSRR